MNTILPMALLRGLVLIVGTVLVFALTVQGMSRGQPAALLAIVASPLIMFLIARPQVWLVLVAGLFYSWIYVPGLTDSLALFYIATAAMIPVLVARGILVRPPVRSSRLLKFAVLGYLAVILAIALKRGFGMRILGSSLWGGAAYVHLTVVLSLFLVGDALVLTPQLWRRALAFFFLGGLIPSLAEIVFLLGRGEVWFLYRFVKPEGYSALQNLDVILSGHGVLRFQVSKYVSMIFAMMLALFPFRPPYSIPILLSFGVAVFFTGMSGHRSTALYLLLLTPVATYFLTRRFLLRFCLVYAAGLIGLSLLMRSIGSLLPMAIQRAFSWAPYARISPEAMASAAGTIDWRLEVWKRVLEMLPDYWLVGRGFAFDASDIRYHIQTFKDSVEWAVTTHNYHNGPLSMLIDLGILGLFFGSLIIIGGAVRHMRLLRTEWRHEGLLRCHHVLLASYCVDVVRFYFVYGEASGSIVALTFQLLMLEGMHRTNLILAQQPAAVPPAEPATAPAPPIAARKALAGLPAPARDTPS